MDKLTINDEASATADGKYSREFHISNIEAYLNFGFPRTEFLLDTGVESTSGNSVCPISLLILFLIQTLSSRNLPPSTLVPAGVELCVNLTFLREA